MPKGWKRHWNFTGIAINRPIFYYYILAHKGIKEKAKVTISFLKARSRSMKRSRRRP
jgi:hypothetical protein